MPLHDYRCECGNVQEVLTTRVSEEPVLKCEKCGSDKMEKLIANQLTFKLIGEGWFADGYEHKYTKSHVGEEKVKPVYSRKKAKEALKKYKDNALSFTQQKI
jgi:putative FmdB family regulatory protein